MNDHDLIGVIDESSPPNSAGGVSFVVATAAVFAPDGVTSALGEMFPPGRSRPFHWISEGDAARDRILDIVVESGVVAVSYYAHVGRRHQVQARRDMLTRAADWAATEGVGRLMIEASDAATMGRDRAALLDHYKDRGGVPFAYDWPTKNEPLLWIADAIAGATSAYVVGIDTRWYDRLASAGVLSVIAHA